jgi:spore coat protein CotH
VVAVAMPLDLAGQWQAKVDGPQDTVTYVFNFDVKGDSFTGTVKITNKKEEATGQITDGKIDGDKITFTVHIPIDGAPGTASASGIALRDQVKLTIEGEDSHNGHRNMELTITRAK